MLSLAALVCGLAQMSFAVPGAFLHRGSYYRNTVVVHHGFPIDRSLPTVVVHPSHRAVRVAPVVFLPTMMWTATVVSPPQTQQILSEDTATIAAEEQWADCMLNVDGRGREMDVELGGKVQLGFAEVVFQNGQTTVVDFGDKTYMAGRYSLVDFSRERSVDHVRIVARAKSDEAVLTVRMR